MLEEDMELILDQFIEGVAEGRDLPEEDVQLVRDTLAAMLAGEFDREVEFMAEYGEEVLEKAEEEAEAAERRATGEEEHVIRLAMPEEGESVVNDLLRGEIRIANAQVDDQVLLKSDGYPTYHLANVVDDHLMEPPDTFEGRLPRALQDRAPRVVETEDLLNQRVEPWIGVLEAVGGPPLESRSVRAFGELSLEPIRREPIFARHRLFLYRWGFTGMSHGVPVSASLNR